MASKKLSEKKCAHFYMLRDALGDYAYDKLDIEEALYIGKGKKYSNENMYDEQVLAETLDELWKNPEIIEEFINDNPAGLVATDLDIIRSWRDHLNGWFVIFKHRGKLLFMRDKVLFEVSGLWDDIESLLNKAKYPIMVDTTLLPFDNRIVYHGFLNHLSISMGEGMRDMLDSEIKEALRDEKVITTGNDFIEAASRIKEKETKEKAERVERDAMLAKEAREQMPGFHKGALAGLSEQEREAAISAEIKRDVSDDFRKLAVNELKRGTTKGHMTRDLEDLIAKEPKQILQRWVLVLGVEVPGKGTKADLIQALLPELRTNPFLIELTLRAGLNIDQFDAFRNLYEAGGVMEIPEDDVGTLVGLPSTVRLMCYSFYSKGSEKGGGKFSFVIPEDIMGILDDMDWDEIREEVICYEAMPDIAEAVIELRGIANITDIYNEFCRFYPSSFDESEFKGAIAHGISEDRVGCVWLEADDGEDYLMDYEIAAYYRSETEPADLTDDMDEDDYGYLEEAFMKGPLQPICFIEDLRKDKQPRPLEKDMLSSDAVYDWKCARPAVRAMRDYLDNNVPDSQNDYFYADAVIEDLVDYMTFGSMDSGKVVSDWIKILEDHDYLPTEAHLNRVIGLLMNMHNALPSWTNNGWAPNELADIKFGRKSFYNEDGSRMKVGRNDPCPCGSGKKYKHCCGR